MRLHPFVPLFVLLTTSLLARRADAGPIEFNRAVEDFEAFEDFTSDTGADVVIGNGLLTGVDQGAPVLRSGGEAGAHKVLFANAFPPHAWLFDNGRDLEPGHVDFLNGIVNTASLRPAVADINEGGLPAPVHGDSLSLPGASGNAVAGHVLVITANSIEFCFGGDDLPLQERKVQTSFSIAPIVIAHILPELVGAVSFLAIENPTCEVRAFGLFGD